MKEASKNLSHKLAECVHACNDCFSACLNEEDIKMMVGCIRLDKECAEICATTLNMVYMDARFSRQMLTLCKEVCEACEKECRKHPVDHCQECADACKACAAECGNFLAKL